MLAKSSHHKRRFGILDKNSGNGNKQSIELRYSTAQDKKKDRMNYPTDQK